MIYVTRFGIICGVIAAFVFGIMLGEPQETTIQLPPCATEDSDNCYWQADQAGNQIGASFVVIDGIQYSPNILGE